LQLVLIMNRYSYLLLGAVILLYSILFTSADEKKICFEFIGYNTDQTRLGDRLLDFWSAITIFNLNNRTAPCTLFWEPNFITEFENQDLLLQNCKLLSFKKRGYHPTDLSELFDNYNPKQHPHTCC